MLPRDLRVYSHGSEELPKGAESGTIKWNRAFAHPWQGDSAGLNKNTGKNLPTRVV